MLVNYEKCHLWQWKKGVNMKNKPSAHLKPQSPMSMYLINIIIILLCCKHSQIHITEQGNVWQKNIIEHFFKKKTQTAKKVHEQQDIPSNTSQTFQTSCLANWLKFLTWFNECVNSYETVTTDQNVHIFLKMDIS